MVLPVTADATWLNPGSVQYNAQELRRSDAALLGGDGSSFGVPGGIARHGDGSLAVTVSAADVLTLQAGPVIIPGNSGTANGGYRTALGASDTYNLTARNATNPRVDLVVARVLDTDVVAANPGFTARFEVITGVAAAAPVVPTLPLLAVELARISVPASGGGAATVDGSFRTYATALGGRLPVATAARLPANAAKWDLAVALDTGVKYTWTGAAWVEDGTWSTSGVAITPGSGVFNNAVATARWTVINRTLFVSIVASVIDVGSGTGALKLGMPVPIRIGGSSHVGTGRETQATGAMLSAVAVSASQIDVLRYDNASMLASGRTAHMLITAEIA